MRSRFIFERFRWVREQIIERFGRWICRSWAIHNRFFSYLYWIRLRIGPVSRLPNRRNYTHSNSEQVDLVWTDSRPHFLHIQITSRWHREDKSLKASAHAKVLINKECSLCTNRCGARTAMRMNYGTGANLMCEWKIKWNDIRHIVKIDGKLLARMR